MSAIAIQYAIPSIVGVLLLLAPVLALIRGRTAVAWISISSVVLYTAMWQLSLYEESSGDPAAAKSILASAQLVGLELLVLEPMALFAAIRPKGLPIGSSSGPD